MATHRRRLIAATVLALALSAAVFPTRGVAQVRTLPEDAILRQPVGDRDSGDRFGHAVAILLDRRIVVGAPGDDERGTDAGAVYVFDRIEDAWHLTAKIAPESLEAGDRFGTAVAVSYSDMVVGAPGDDRVHDEQGTRIGTAIDRGAAYIFSNVSGTWTLQHRFEPRVPPNEPAGGPQPGPGDNYGSSVAITSGFRYLIAAPLTDGGTADVGVVYAHQYDGQIAQRFYITDAMVAAGAPAPGGGRFGAALGTPDSGFVVIVGQPYAGNDEAGWVHTYRLNFGGRFGGFSFGHEGAVTAPQGTAGAGRGLGSSVAVSFTGAYAAGAPQGVRSGAASVGTAFTFINGVPPATPADVRTLPSAGAPDGFGAAVAMRQDLLFVASVASGAPGTPVAGFDRLTTGEWEQALSLSPTSVPIGSDFGASLSASDTFVAVGSPGADPGGYVAVFNLLERDRDGDALPDRWETQFGLDPSSADGANGAIGDLDGDGLTNLAEYTGKTHPAAPAAFTRYFAEGATTWQFATALSIANPDRTTTATVQLRFMKANGFVRTFVVYLEPLQKRDVDVMRIADMDGAEFSTMIESNILVGADRAMWWPRTFLGGPESAYGAHAERAVTAPAPTWYFAEGATHSGFELFYLLLNPGTEPIDVRARYLRPSGAPVEKVYTLPPRARTTIWVDAEMFDTPSGPATVLDNTDVAAVFDALTGPGIIVERALYRDSPDHPFEAGHESAGVTAPSLDWYFAEGATSIMFDTFFLVANPTDTPAQVRATYLLDDGRTYAHDITVAANARTNIWADVESLDGGATYPLSTAAFSTRISSTNGVPVIAERSMWWPGPTSDRWYEAHNTFGSTETGTAWLSAYGAPLWGFPQSTSTYLLILNPGMTEATVNVTRLSTSPEPPLTYSVPPHSRMTIEVTADSAIGYGALVESVGSPAAEIVVERATYMTGANQPMWSAGTAALLTKIR